MPLSSALLDLEPAQSSFDAEFIAGICNNCKHIINTSESRFRSAYSDQRYVLKTAVSGSMSSNLKSILDFVTQDCISLDQQTVLEIGSGAGEVAGWFADQGAQVSTIDPAIVGYDHDGIDHYQINFDVQSLKILDKKYDLIVCRHILEHTNDPKEFLKICKLLLNSGGKIYIEVPNLANTLETLRLVDFFNDHLQYFTENSLRLLAQTQGLAGERVAYWLNQSHLGMILSDNNSVEYHNAPADLNIPELIDSAEQNLRLIIEQMATVDKIVIYGAGAHSCTFVSQLTDDLRHKIKCVFDRSSSKQGRYLPGLTIPISEPTIEAVKEQQLIINTASLYPKEVEEFLRSSLGWAGPILHL